MIAEDPYRLARDIKGIGFRTADAIAMKLGIEKTAMIRARAGISFPLTEALNDGHWGLPRDELLPMAIRLLEIPGPIDETPLGLDVCLGEAFYYQYESRPIDITAHYTY